MDQRSAFFHLRALPTGLFLLGETPTVIALCASGRLGKIRKPGARREAETSALSCRCIGRPHAAAVRLALKMPCAPALPRRGRAGNCLAPPIARLPYPSALLDGPEEFPFRAVEALKLHPLNDGIVAR